jgi:hypothetical protein
LNAASAYIPNLAIPINESWLNLSDKAVILFSDKKSPPPLWKGVSVAFKNASVRVGFCNNQTLQRLFGVIPVPTILLVDGENRVPYAGAVKFGAIRQAVKEFVTGRYFQSPTPRPTTPPKLVHALASGEFEKECKGKKRFCVIGVETVTEEALENVAQRYRKDPFRFYVAKASDLLEKGIWIFHHRRDEVVKVETVTELSVVLQRVIDGSAKWEALKSAQPSTPSGLGDVNEALKREL